MKLITVGLTLLSIAYVNQAITPALTASGFKKGAGFEKAKCGDASAAVCENASPGFTEILACHKLVEKKEGCVVSWSIEYKASNMGLSGNSTHFLLGHEFPAALRPEIYSINITKIEFKSTAKQAKPDGVTKLDHVNASKAGTTTILEETGMKSFKGAFTTVGASDTLITFTPAVPLDLAPFAKETGSVVVGATYKKDSAEINLDKKVDITFHATLKAGKPSGGGGTTKKNNAADMRISAFLGVASLCAVAFVA